MGEPVTFFEVLSPDAARAQKFYAELFGWHVATAPGLGEYAFVDTQAGEGAGSGGIGPSTEPGETGVKVYIRVSDLEAFLDRAEKLGGHRLVPPTDLPGVYGRFAIFTDPDGNQVGLWKPAP